RIACSGKWSPASIEWDGGPDKRWKRVTFARRPAALGANWPPDSAAHAHHHSSYPWRLTMTTRSPWAVLVVCLAVGVACGSDGGVEATPPGSEPAPLFTTLAVLPTAADLFAVAPGNTVQLTIGAYDQTGAPIPNAAAASYSTSAPAIVGVSTGGVVTAVAPGTA